MLGLGASGPELHRAPVESIEAGGIGGVFCFGPFIHALGGGPSSGVRGGYAETATGLEASVLDAVRAGDAIMVKGSLGSKMGPIVKALEKQFPRQAALDQAPAPR